MSAKSVDNSTAPSLRVGQPGPERVVQGEVSGLGHHLPPVLCQRVARDAGHLGNINDTMEN